MTGTRPAIRRTLFTLLMLVFIPPVFAQQGPLLRQHTIAAPQEGPVIAGDTGTVAGLEELDEMSDSLFYFTEDDEWSYFDGGGGLHVMVRFSVESDFQLQGLSMFTYGLPQNALMALFEDENGMPGAQILPIFGIVEAVQLGGQTHYGVYEFDADDWFDFPAGSDFWVSIHAPNIGAWSPFFDEHSTDDRNWYGSAPGAPTFECPGDWLISALGETADPLLTLTLTPSLGLPVTVPPGGMFNYDVLLQVNDLPFPQVTADLWTSAVLPNGNEYGPINLFTLLLSDNQQGEYLFVPQPVPPFAPEGEYVFRVNIGREAVGYVHTSDEFPFTVEGNAGDR